MTQRSDPSLGSGTTAHPLATDGVLPQNFPAATCRRGTSPLICALIRR